MSELFAIIVGGGSKWFGGCCSVLQAFYLSLLTYKFISWGLDFTQYGFPFASCTQSMSLRNGLVDSTCSRGSVGVR